MNSMTKPDPHPYHHVIIANDQESVTLCILNGNGEGGYDHWKVDKLGHARVDGIRGHHFFQDYWQDYLPLEIISNVYKVLDFYVKPSNNVVELGQKFCPDDIPF